MRLPSRDQSTSDHEKTIQLVRKTVDEISRILYRLQQDAGIHACALLSQEGLPVAFTSDSVELDRDIISAMTSASFSIAIRTIKEYQLGHFDDIILQASKGQIITIAVGKESLLSCYAPSSSKIGLILLYMRRAVEEIQALLETFNQESAEIEKTS